MKNITIKILLLVLCFNSLSCTENLTSKRQTLLLLYENLKAAICDCALGDKLALQTTFSCCDILRTKYKMNDKLCDDDCVMVRDIIALINIRLMHNPALIAFLNNVDISVESHQRLSDDEYTIILKNSALLVPFDELFAFTEIIDVMHGKSSKLSLQHLKILLKNIELNMTSKPLQLWERKQFFKRMHEISEYHAVALAEKIKSLKQFDRCCCDINTIFTVIGVTDEYIMALKRLDPCGGYSQRKLYELFEDAFCGEKETLTLEAYAQHIEKCVSQNEKIR